MVNVPDVLIFLSVPSSSWPRAGPTDTRLTSNAPTTALRIRVSSPVVCSVAILVAVGPVQLWDVGRTRGYNPTSVLCPGGSDERRHAAHRNGLRDGDVAHQVRTGGDRRNRLRRTPARAQARLDRHRSPDQRAGAP